MRLRRRWREVKNKILIAMIVMLLWASSAHAGALYVPSTGADITNTPAGDIAATDVQGAINELEDEKGPRRPKAIVKSSSATLTALEVSSTQLNNFGQSVTTNSTLTFPVAAEGYNVMLLIGTLLNATYYVEVKANTTDKIFFDGVAGADNGSVRATAQAVGSYLTCFTFQTGASAYDWICRTGVGSWFAQ